MDKEYLQNQQNEVQQKNNGLTVPSPDGSVSTKFLNDIFCKMHALATDKTEQKMVHKPTTFYLVQKLHINKTPVIRSEHGDSFQVSKRMGRSCAD